MPRHSVREQLMEAGFQTLYRRGFNGCGVQEITDAAGVPKGSFYNHFKSKEALALQALELFWDIGANRRALLSDTEVDPVERLRRHFHSLSEAIVRHGLDAGCLIGNFSAELPSQSQAIRGRLSEIYTSWIGAVELAVGDAVSAGRLRQGMPPDDVASFLVTAWEGAVLRSKVEQNRLPLDQFERVVFTSLFT